MMNHEDDIYNRNKVEEKTRAIKDSLYGYDTLLSEYVCEKEGVLSDKKIEELANRLIGIMISYGRDYQYGIGGAHRRCLHLYLYLIIRAYGGRVKTFGDILEAAADMMRSHNSLEDLILHETDWQPGDGEIGDDEADDEDGYYGEYQSGYKTKRCPRYGRGFFEDLDRSYEILTGHRIGDEMTEEELQEIWDRYMASQKKILRKYNHLYLEDEYRDFRELLERQDAIREYQYRKARGVVKENKDTDYSSMIWTAEDEEAARLKEMEEREKWKDSLQDPEKFTEAYKEFRSLFFSIGFDRDGLEEAMILLLCREGRSGLTDNERLLRVHIQLDKAYLTARKR